MSNDSPTSNETSRLIAQHVREVPDFPKPGVVFKDITPLLGDAAAFARVIEELARQHPARSSSDEGAAPGVDAVAGIEARGFIIGSALALALGVGFVPIRKAGKLPGATHSLTYDLEYAQASIEIHRDAITPGSRVLLVDDVLATGGTAAASWELLTTAGAHVTGFATVVELALLGGRKALGERQITSLHVVGSEGGA